MNKIYDQVKQLSFYNTLRHGSVYMFSFVIVQFITVLSIPVFTKLLTPTDFGIYEVFNNTVRFLSVIVSLNLFTGFYRYYFEENMNKHDLIQFLLRTAFLAFVISSLIFFIFKRHILQLINLPADIYIWIPISIFSTIILNFFAVYNNVQQKSTRAAIWQLVTQILKVVIAILCILYIRKDYSGRIVGENGILLILTLLICFIYFKKYIGWSEILHSKNEIIKYSTSFIPIGISSYIISYVDLVLINKMQGSSASGVYSYAYKFAVIYSGFSQSFITANRPNLFNLLKENKEAEVVDQMRSMFKLITVLSCTFIFFAADAGKILSLKKEFDAALHLLPLLVFGYVFSDMSEIYNFFLYHSKKVKLFYISFTITALVNFFANLYLIPRYGYQIAAYTTLFSYIILFFSTYLVCKFFTSLSVPRWTVFIDYLLIIAGVTILVFCFGNYITNFWLLNSIKMILLLGVIIYIYNDKIKHVLLAIK